MHAECEQWIRSSIERFDIKPCRVLDIGSCDINGSVRKILEPMGFDVVGLDWRPGPGVDIVAVAHEWLSEKRSAEWPMITCCEMLEHDPFWQATIRKALKSLCDGGHIIITCATMGREEHEVECSPGGGMHYENLLLKDILNASPVWFCCDLIVCEQELAPTHDVRITARMEG